MRALAPPRCSSAPAEPDTLRFNAAPNSQKGARICHLLGQWRYILERPPDIFRLGCATPGTHATRCRQTTPATPCGHKRLAQQQGRALRRGVAAKRCVVPRGQPPGPVAHTAVWGAGPGTAPHGAVSRTGRAARLRGGVVPTTGFGRARRDPQRLSWSGAGGLENYLRPWVVHHQHSRDARNDCVKFAPRWAQVSGPVDRVSAFPYRLKVTHG